MGDDAILIIIVLVIALMLIGWLLYLAAGLVLLFTAFVMQLPIILSIIMFILFPPTLIVFLVGLAFLHFGIAADRDGEKERSRRRALGYDE